MTTAPDRPPPRARTRVLIVEDDASARTGLIELVRAWGYDTTGAVDGEDALRQVTADQPDVVLADLVRRPSPPAFSRMYSATEVPPGGLPFGLPLWPGWNLGMSLF